MRSWAKNLPLEEIPCILCASQDLEELYIRDGGFNCGINIRIVKCRKCSLVFQNPRIIPEKRARLYDKDYCIFDHGRDAFDLKNAQIFFHALTETGKPSGRLLDVGCSKGWFLYLARKGGWETYGLEISELAASYAREKLKLDVTTGTLCNHSFPEKYFDCITMWDLLEHTENPIEELIQANHLLKDDGLLILETPNCGSIYSKILRSHWTGYMIYHNYYFSYHTLKKVLEKARLHIVKMVTPKVNFFSKDGFERWKLRELSGRIASGMLGKNGKEMLLRKLGLFGKPSYKEVTKLNDSHLNEMNLAQDSLRKTWVDYINYLTDFLFQNLKLGDALRVYAKRG